MKEQPSRERLAQLAALAPGGVFDLVSRRSVRFRELGLKDRELSTDEWLDMLANEPKMLRRPLIFDSRTVIVGYDEAALQRLLDD